VFDGLCDLYYDGTIEDACFGDIVSCPDGEFQYDTCNTGDDVYCSSETDMTCPQLDECLVCGGDGLLDHCRDQDGDGFGNDSIHYDACDIEDDSWVLDCTDEDDGIYCESNLFDCAGTLCGQTLVDCSGECGGSVIVNECGICPSENIQYNDEESCFGQYIAFNVGNHFLIVPEGIDKIFVKSHGAAGGNISGNNPYGTSSGNGAKIQGTLNVLPGDSVYVNVGSIDGFNGGGQPGEGSLTGNYAASGGGASDLRINGNTLDHRVLIAGGGGGGSIGGSGGDAGLNGLSGGGSFGGSGGSQKTLLLINHLSLHHLHYHQYFRRHHHQQ
jgi:hypothetical protein